MGAEKTSHLPKVLIVVLNPQHQEFFVEILSPYFSLSIHRDIDQAMEECAREPAQVIIIDQNGRRDRNSALFCATGQGSCTAKKRRTGLSTRAAGAYLAPWVGTYPSHRRIQMVKSVTKILMVRFCPLPDSTPFTWLSDLPGQTGRRKPSLIPQQWSSGKGVKVVL